MRLTLLLLLMGGLTACDPDPARSVKIISRPAKSAAIAVADQEHVQEWKPADCPPPAEEAGQALSDFSVKGPCAFAQTGGVHCSISKDDMLITVTRPALHGGTLVVFINVEGYHGPGKYDDSQMFVSLQNGTTIYRWSGDLVPVEVAEDLSHVDLPIVRLGGEPMLTDCSRKLGSATNFQFTCATRTTRAPIETTTEVVSGRLTCAKESGD